MGNEIMGRYYLILAGIFLVLSVAVAPAGLNSVQRSCAAITTIKAKMKSMEQYAQQNTGGIGNANGTMGFKDARTMLLARSETYRELDDVLKSAEAAR